MNKERATEEPPPPSSSSRQSSHPTTLFFSTPMFDFPKKIHPSTSEDSPRDQQERHQDVHKHLPRMFNESMNTCPLTISNLSADGPGSFSLGGSSTTASSTNGLNDDSNRSSSNLCDGHHSHSASHHRDNNQDGEADHGCNDGNPHDNLSSSIRPKLRNSIRRSSASEASWPAESPDPLSATARWACRSSPPDSPLTRSNRHERDSFVMMDTVGEVNDASQELDGSGSSSQLPLDCLDRRGSVEGGQQQQPQHQHQQHQHQRSLDRNSSADNIQLSNHSLYRPVRRNNHMNMNNINAPKTAAEFLSSVGGAATFDLTKNVENNALRTRRISRRSTAFTNSNNHITTTTTPRHSLSSSTSTQRTGFLPRRSSFAMPSEALHATIVFVDLEGYSKTSDKHQKQMTCDFMSTLRNLLTFAYGEMPVRGNIDDYVILPTGDGAAVIVIRPPRREIHKGCGQCEGGWCETCKLNEMVATSKDELLTPCGIHCQHCEQQSLRTTEETALWIGASLLLWASQRHIGLRVGLNSGELSIVEDPYGDPNVCGDAINMAARIMDTALPGQILASASSVITNLNVLLAEEMATADLLHVYQLDGPHHHHYNQVRKQCEAKNCDRCPRIKYEVAKAASEVVVKHGVTTNVQSITCMLHSLPRPEDLPPEFQSNGEASIHSASLIKAQKDSTNTTGDSHHRHGLMSSMKKNPLKQSFASLSSLQPSGNSSSSLRGSLRNLQNLLKRGSRDHLRGSMSDNKAAPGGNSSWKLGPESGGGSAAHNSSWKLGPSSPKTSWKLSESPRQQQQQLTMSMLSQLSNLSADDDMNLSSKTLATSNSTAITVQQQLAMALASGTSSAAIPQHVGNHRTPATKWYMKIKPTEMQSAANNQIKPKVLPQELIRRHQRIAFLGIMHDNLSRGFIKILENDPSHRWDQVYIFFPSDNCLKYHLAKNYRDQPVETLISNKQECRLTLKKLLSPVVRDLRFLQYDQLMHCGSYWDWKDPGGFIHISPLTWGANPKTCPAMNYYWNSKVPSPEYRVYRDGLEYLLDTATQFADDEDDDHEEFVMDDRFVEEENARQSLTGDPTQ